MTEVTEEVEKTDSSFMKSDTGCMWKMELDCWEMRVEEKSEK